ncbi:hypothetical protein [Ruegeria sp. R14_0]|uniref:hypothetical protein n=1 Tax=Ruegeria sp. R14_0 TaxID=2821100 RepID=UPI001AD966AA|nr:hypothetical protein [Ruegeria sp. R14_0]MBO9448213.1 hypothetical protein [Ruegeria sp. R14_0]
MDTTTTETSKFVEKAKACIGDIGAELSELERKANAAGDRADDWSASQVEKLKEDWSQAKVDMEDIADRAKIEGEEAVREAKEKAERHYEALQAAVKAYRDHLDQVADT